MANPSPIRDAQIFIAKHQKRNDLMPDHIGKEMDPVTGGPKHVRGHYAFRLETPHTHKGISYIHIHAIEHDTGKVLEECTVRWIVGDGLAQLNLVDFQSAKGGQEE